MGATLGRVERQTAIFVALIAVGAAWLLLHVALLIRTARAPGLAIAWRVVAWLPPATPIASWIAGARVRAVAWVLLGALYVALRRMV